MLSPVVIVAGAGTTIELLNAPGTFGASTWIPVQGQSVELIYEVSTTRWKTAISYAGSGAPGTAAYNPGWYAAGTINIDPQNVEGTSSDANAGTSTGTALRTWAEAVRRWGSTAPALSVATAITFLSSHTNGTDPVVFIPTVSGNVQVSIQGAAPASVAAVFTRNTAKSRAAGTNALLTGSFSAGAPAQGKLVQNTTAGKSSRAWIAATDGGANWKISQPLTPGAIGGAVGTEVDTWTSTDTVDILTPVAVNIVLVGMSEDLAQQGVIYQLTIFDPAGAGNSTVEISGNWGTLEVSSQRNVLYSDAPIDVTQNITNSLTLGAQVAFTGGPARLAGAAYADASSTFACAYAYWDLDTIIGDGFTSLAVPQAYLGLVALDGATGVSTGVTILTPFYGATNVLYGTAGSALQWYNRSRCYLGAGTWTQGITAPAMTGGIGLNASLTANSQTVAGGVVTIHAGITTSVANLDAAAGVAGFGGTAFNLAGASLSNVD